MNKQEFFAALQKGLSALPMEDRKKSLDFYNEMIEDRMEEGLSEEEAVAAVGSIDEILPQILAEVPPTEFIKPKRKEKHGGQIFLLVLGAPLWLPLLLAIISTAVAIYLVLWTIILTLYAVDLSFAVSGVAGIAGAFIFYWPVGNIGGAIFILGIGLLCIGLSILLFYGSNQITKGILSFSRKIAKRIPFLLKRKEEN